MRLAVLAVVGLLACGVPTPQDIIANRQWDRSRLTGLEIATLDDRTIQTAFDAVERLRPEFLTRVRDPRIPVIVYDNRSPLGDLSTLRYIPAKAITLVRYLSPVDAQLEFGQFCNCPSGVLQVLTGVR